MDALEKNEAWDLVELPMGSKVVGCKWVSKLKRCLNDKVQWYKERLVENGYPQMQGIDFHEIFSLLVKFVSIRVLLALVSLHNLELE
jgi:hypothetical protein